MWVASFDYNINKLKDFYDITRYQQIDYESTQILPTNDDIIIALCPQKYCCKSVFGCDYLKEYLKYQYQSGNNNNFTFTRRILQNMDDKLFYASTNDYH